MLLEKKLPMRLLSNQLFYLSLQQCIISTQLVWEFSKPVSCFEVERVRYNLTKRRTAEQRTAGLNRFYVT